MRRDGAERIDRSSEREKTKAEERRRLAEALRANLIRRKQGRSGGLPQAPAPGPPAGKE